MQPGLPNSSSARKVLGFEQYKLEEKNLVSKLKLGGASIELLDNLSNPKLSPNMLYV